jgi:uncharacterized protein YkwD
MKFVLPIFFWLTLVLCGSAVAQAEPRAPAEMISAYRLQNGEGQVTDDPALTRVAHEQAAAMAAKDVLDHSVLAPFGSRVAVLKAQRAAENIAYGYDNFPKTLGMWIDSPEHRKNLLMHGASKVGVASAKNSTSHRTYWAMVITGGSTASPSSAHRTSAAKACRMEVLGLCL